MCQADGGRMMDEKTIQQLTKIANNESSSISSLDWQNSDNLDFHELSVGQIKRMLMAAYKLGQSEKLK